MKEFKENKIPLAFYRWMHCRINEQAFKRVISKEQANLVLRMYFNIEKRMCPLIIKEMEILELLKQENGFYIVKESRPIEEVILNLTKKLGLV